MERLNILILESQKIEHIIYCSRCDQKKTYFKRGTIVEGTAGNTGIGLAVVYREYGLKLK